ncbi:MAG TPA: hypothetical protein G4N98_08445 [Thermoflexia bacterium]|nr:hypothetical protein [Thermoflexia bacterium]
MPATLTKDEEKLITALAEQIIDNYDFHEPPVPIEQILKSPPPNLLGAIDISDLSLVFGIGEHHHEYRMAVARLLYREICRQESINGGNMPYSKEAAHLFAAALLIPQKWIARATRWPWVTLINISEKFQVPEYTMAARLAQLGRNVRGMD